MSFSHLGNGPVRRLVDASGFSPREKSEVGTTHVTWDLHPGKPHCLGCDSTRRHPVFVPNLGGLI